MVIVTNQEIAWVSLGSETIARKNKKSWLGSGTMSRPEAWAGFGSGTMDYKIRLQICIF